MTDQVIEYRTYKAAKTLEGLQEPITAGRRYVGKRRILAGGNGYEVTIVRNNLGQEHPWPFHEDVEDYFVDEGQVTMRLSKCKAGTSLCQDLRNGRWYLVRGATILADFDTYEEAKQRWLAIVERFLVKVSTAGESGETTYLYTRKEVQAHYPWLTFLMTAAGEHFSLDLQVEETRLQINAQI